MVDLLPHPTVRLEGHDLYTTVPVTPWEAALGAKVTVPTLDGAVVLKIPSRTQAERVFRLRRKGLPRLEKPAERGDLYARVKLV